VSKIHRPPRGLQHLLGSQSFGHNPDQLNQFVQPTLDLTGYYAAELLKTESNIGALATEGLITTVTFSAPVAIVACMLESGTAVAAAEVWAGSLRLDGLGGTNQNVAIYASAPASYDAGGFPTIGYTLPTPLVVPGGAQVKAYAHMYAGNLLTYTLRVLYVDLNPDPN